MPTTDETDDKGRKDANTSFVERRGFQTMSSTINDHSSEVYKDVEDVSRDNFTYRHYVPKTRNQKFGRNRDEKHVLTCYEINGISEANEWLKNDVSACAKCDNYRLNRPMSKRLLSLKNQDEAGRNYCCQTLWLRQPQEFANTSEFAPELNAEDNTLPVIARGTKRKSATLCSETLIALMCGDGNDSEDSRPKKKKSRSKISQNAKQVEGLNVKLKEQQRVIEELIIRRNEYDSQLKQLQKKCDHAERETRVKDQRIENIEKKYEEVDRKMKEKDVSLKMLTMKTKTVDNAFSKETNTANAVEILLKARHPGPGRAWNKTHADELTIAIFEDEMLNGEAAKQVISRVYEQVKDTCPLRDAAAVAKAMDLAGGVVNHSGLHVLRRVRTPGCTTGWLASHRQVTKVMKQVEAEASTYVPYEVLTHVDGVQFEYLAMLRFALQLYKLEDIAKTDGGVMIAMTLDQADLSRNVSHVTAGLKIVDYRAIDPETKLPLGVGNSVTVQSRDVCIPFKIILSKDSGNVYEDEFKDFFDFFNSLQKEECYGYKSFSVASPQDVSSFWKCLKRGGAAKVKKEFCHCCSCESINICSPCKIKCERCKSLGKEHCYHWPVGDAKTLAAVRTELDKLKDSPEHGVFFNKDIPKLNSHWDADQIDSEKDMSSVDFQPNGIAETQEYLNKYLRPDLRSLGLSCLGSPEQLQERLKGAIVFLQEKEELEKNEEAAKYPGAMIAIRQAVPCILHCENRCGEKILKMLLIEGMNERDGNTRSQKEMMSTFEERVNTRVLGSMWRKTNWKIPQCKSEKGSGGFLISEVTMPNTHVRKFLRSFNALASIVIIDNQRRAQWIDCIALYKEVIDMARSKDDFTDAQIDEFQDLADVFFQKWLKLNKRDGMTNYFHMIGSGHLRYYLQEWRNLYRYSQQGWESLNALIKMFYFRRTQRGGHGGKKGEPNSKIKPIARWFLRRLFWLSGKPVPG
jgi:hypothetical protein